MESVFLWVIFVLPSERTESALLAIKVINWSTETVSFLNKQDPQIWAVELGTGITKDAFNAPKDGCSDPTVFVFQWVIHVQLSVPMESALPVTKDINWLTETVNFLNRMDLQIWDAEHGTGTINVVFNAPKDGSLELMAFVFPWMTYVLHLMQMEFVQLVTKDTLWSMEIVSFRNKQGPPIWDAGLGTGTIKSA